MEQANQIPTNQDDEISLKDLILKAQDWIKYLWSKWIIILVVGILGAALGLGYAYTRKPEYKAELTFVLEDSKSNPLSSYAGIASQFGIDLGGSSSSGVFTGDNIIAFLRSRLMVEKTLLSKIRIDGKEQSLADRFIKVYELDKSWSDNPRFRNINFLNERSTFSLQQDSILNKIYESLTKSQLEVVKADKKLSFISVRCISRDEIFSKVFIERLVKEATDFYVETKTKRSKTSVDYLQKKLDSVVILLNRRTYSVATSQDLNQNPAKSIAGVGTELIARDKLVLQTMYAELIKNVEYSRMLMAQETPVIQIVDRPILPLKKEKFGRLKGLIMGGFLAGFLVLAWLIVKKLYKEIMNT